MKKTFLTIIVLMVAATAFAQKGRVYDKFPEDFEMPDTSAKAKYKKADVQLKTGNWTFDQAILGAVENRDRFNGKQSVRIHQNKENSGYLQMNFDLPNGASKVTFMYGVYYKDSPSVIKLEYSTHENHPNCRMHWVSIYVTNRLCSTLYRARCYYYLEYKTF